MVRAVSTLVALGLLACSSASFTPASATRYPARPRDCSVEVLFVAPARPYDEIGVFDLDQSGLGDERDERARAARVRALVGAQACEVGADALIGVTTANGMYMHAVAIRWRRAAE